MKPILLLLLSLSGIVAAAEPTLKLDLGGGTTMDLVLVPAGQFTQGSPASENSRAGDETQRNVRISHDYYIGRTSVTRGQWERFIAETHYRTEAENGTSGGYGWDGNTLSQRKDFTWKSPGFPQTADHPVCLLTFPDAQAFCTWLERKSGRKITLPTEAQWEYACRAGTTTAWHGPDADIAWHKGNAGNTTHPVDSKPANPWGIFIAGNVSEWCLDWYAPYPAGDAMDPRQDNQNLSDKPRRVLRGGSWNRGASNTRSAARYRADPRSRNADTGFRILCSTEVAAATPPPSPPKPPAATELPPVEAEAPAEPTTPDATPTYDELRHRSTPSSPPLIAVLFKGLFCLLIPVAVVISLFKLITRGRNPAPPMPSTGYRPQPQPAYQPPIRRTNDGFWINGDYPEGTLLKIRYMVAGAAMVQELIYRPGDDGQFVFTGSEPNSVSVIAGDDPQNDISPAIFSTPPAFPHRRQDDDDDDRRRPPIFPSAY
ncbi:formylglycine-generating enzyme family protein [Luteolibacter soli]|uniref:Formylglycine-generating enzyme family protein n=1 Tax=Luteolibacter soli TaxID=3135280 RepID=A0ABU9AXS4_9BACT